MAVDDAYQIYHDQTLTVGDPGVAMNDHFSAPMQSVVLDSQPSLGQITHWDGLGGFTYVPDFHKYGQDSVTYHDVDQNGRSSNEATVTIDVIENAPAAVNVGYSILHDHVLTVGPPGVLANAYDADLPDQGNLTGVLLSGRSMEGLSDFISGGVDHPLLVDGSFVLTPPPHWAGTVLFKFAVSDGILQSAPATATINVTDQPPYAGNDQYTTGWNKGDPLALKPLIVAPPGVQQNDMDPDEGDQITSTVTVQPQHGTLSDYIDGAGVDHPLLVDGSFIYTPNVNYAGVDTFKYTDSDGVMTSQPATVTIMVQKVDMDIWDGGPNGAQVPETKELSRGAYAVANLNDTNGDGTADFAENPVLATAKGRDEVDLMKLVINQPVPAINGTMVSLQYTAGLSLWTDEFKTAPYPSEDGQASISVNSLPMTLYVEADAVSQSLRDMTLVMLYNFTADAVAVTSVWATPTGVSAGSDWHAPGDVIAKFPDLFPPGFAPGMPDVPPLNVMATANGTGVLPEVEPGPNDLGGIRNGIMIQWTIMPPRGPKDGTWESDGVMFDVGRQAEGNQWALANGVWTAQNAPEFAMPAQVEDVNDDPPANDESAAVVMPGNHFYSYDAPGYTTLDASKIPGALNSDEQIYQLHAREFLRVQFDGTRPDGNGVEGSRCSDYQEWWSQISIVVNANGNITRTGAPHKSDIEPTPVFPRLGPPFAN